MSRILTLLMGNKTSLPFARSRIYQRSTMLFVRPPRLNPASLAYPGDDNL